MSSDTKSKEQSKELELLTEDFFKRGKYTYILCGLLQFMILFQNGNMIYMTFAGLPPRITSCGMTNFSTPEWNNKKICDFITNTQESRNCTPVTEGDFDSVNREWKYYCGKDALAVKSSTSGQMFGIIIGSIAGGQLSDLYGRKKVMFISLIFCITFVILSSFAQDLTQLTIIRGFVQFFNENVPKNDRIWIYNVFTWSPNTVLFAIVAYFSGEWRTLARVTAILSIPAVILTFVSAESPRWLIQKGKIEAAKSELKKICKINGRNIGDDAIKEFVDSEHEKNTKNTKSANTRYSFYHLFYTWNFTAYSIILATTFFVASLGNYGTMFNMEKLSGSVYTNSILMGSLRYLLNLIVAFADTRLLWLGRRHILSSSCYAIGSAALLIVLIFALNMKVSLELGLRILQILLVAFTSQLYVTSGIVSAELFPTQVRNLSYSTLQTCSRIGVFLAPYLFVLSALFDSAPYVTLAVITIAVGTSYIFFIPETKGQPLKNEMPGPEERICSKAKKRQILKGPEDEAAEKILSGETNNTTTTSK
ncbi:Solute carrier family 22 member 15 [Strongyloides ratti]|uniref:Solute carrier family 22 member 15 n=1 Tax=Strongyloides ratti TaxID=34506 RepID=A0A090MWF9_STRRB|nr:Solute carrier family 22 member 15 [Strongyloides ratti]CEF63689.1 Solute carrier family 22 member 15 [Strongyloides ratti]